MRRIAAIVLPCVRLEIARAKELMAVADRPPEALLAIVVARRGSTVKDERSLLGNTRLDEVSPEAYALGVRPGHTIAAARAKAADLHVRVVHEDAVRGALARLAEALLVFGATTSFSTAEDVVWVDFTGCAHLFGGEERLAEEIAARVRAMGHARRVGVADGPRIAAQIAWFSRQTVTIAPANQGADAMRSLPVSALPLDGETLRWLKSSGLHTVGDVQALPRRALGLRLGANAAETIALLEGDDRAPLDPYVPPEVPEERVELEYGVTSADALLFIAKRLSALLAARLEGRAMGARRLELVLSLDRALVEDGEPRAVIAINLPSPLVLEAEILAVLRARLESFTVKAPVLAAALRAPELAPRRAAPLDLFVPEARAARALPGLVAELVADLGEDKVGTLALTNRWSPEDRALLLPFGAPREKSPRLASLSGATREPTRILPRPKLLATPPRIEIALRLEAVEWWRSGDGERGHPGARRDYGEAWLANAGAMAWVQIDEEGAKVKGWVD